MGARLTPAQPVVHERDFLFDYIHRIIFKGDHAAALKRYIEGGEDCCRRFAGLCAEHKPDGVRRVLDFASGFGRVARHSARVMPDASWTACDIHPEALEFLRGLGLPAIPSARHPRDWAPPQLYDAVLVLSLFSHLPDLSFGPWMRRIFEAVAPGGIMMFTTHGEVTLQHRWQLPLSSFDSRGFFWQIGGDQPDLDPLEYGTTAATFGYVYAILRDIPQATLVRYQRGFWWGNHDLYVLRRE